MEEQFQRLVQYLDRRFDGIGGEFESLRGEFKDLQRRFDDLQAAVETYAQRADAFFQEMVMLSHKVDRHERWLHQIAERLGVKLEY